MKTTSSRIGRPSARRTMVASACGLAAAGALMGTTEPQPPVGAPLADLTPDQLARFELGKQQFMLDLTPETGLGPIFNQTACGDCHLNPVGATGTQKVLRAGRLDKGGFDPLEEFGGSLFQLEAIDDACKEMPHGSANVFADRVTNGMTGYGLVEAIPDADILFFQNNPPSANVSGVAHMVEPFEDPGNLRVGRFGWKAQVPTILTFSSDASLQEMGLTNRFLPFDNDPNGIDPPTLAECDPIPDDPTGMTYEDGLALGNGVDKEFIDVVTDFQRFMTAPPQTPKSGMSGEVVFNAIGCADCHIRDFTTADDPGLEDALRNKDIKPYGDFLLHDMGLNGDAIPQGAALDNELKTPPLWGLFQRPALWHSGIFESGDFDTRVTNAINAHDDGLISEGRPAALAFAALTPAEQASLLKFLGSLGRREFDLNRDDLITLIDVHGFGDPAALKACFGGGPYTPDDDCAIHDINQDGNVDDLDFKVFAIVFGDLLADCNGNGVWDVEEILAGTLLDDNDNGIPDICEPTCAGDTNGDGGVGILDFLDLLADWGPCDDPPAPCRSDLDLDGQVGLSDFLLLLSLWGPCT